MEYIKLGKSDLTVSRLCLGCMGFGDSKQGMHSWTIGQEKSSEIIKECINRGINFFDTALAYQGGTSEVYLGNALRDNVNREDVVIATKFLPRSQEYIDKGISGDKYVEDMIDISLKNLKMDYIDLYIYHMWDYNTPIEEIMRGLSNVVKKGKARYIGISNCFAWQIAKANYIAELNGFEKFVSIQNHYNLIFREEEREMIPYCMEEDIAITPYSALAGGRLSKMRNETSKRLEEDLYAKSKYDNTKNQDEIVIERVREIAKNNNVSMTEVSLSWLISKSHSPVVGITRMDQIDGIVKSVDFKLTDDQKKYLEDPYISHDLVGVLSELMKSRNKN